MSLQVWLPLNGDLHNQGLDQSVKPTSNSGATLSNNGKIGKCYSFDGTDDWMQWSINKSNYGGKPISYACWFKSDQSKSSGTLLDLAADLCLSYTYSSNTIIFNGWRVYSNSNGTRVGDSFTTPNSYDASKWHHIVAIFDATTNKLYVDGELAGEWQSVSQVYWIPLLGSSYNKFSVGKSAGSSYWVGGLINDIRIYDHVLSIKEIKKLSEGLTLHYKLNDLAMEATTNLFYPTLDTSCQTLTGFSANQNVTLSLDTINSIPAIKATSNQNTSTPGIKLGTFAITENTDYTLSCILESNCVSCLSAYQIKSSPQTIKTQGEKIIINFNSGSSTSITFYAFMIVPETNQYIKIAQPQLEQKNHITAYTINNRNNNNIYDSSGYRNNALANGSSQITNNNSSIKYNNCANFTSGGRIATPVASSTFMPRDMITVNIWIKTTASGNRFLSCTESGGFNFESASGAVSFPLYITGKGYTRVNGTTTWASLNDNNWHMITATYDRQNTKLYIDGVLDTNTASSYPNTDIGYNASTPFTLGAEAQTIASPLAGTYVGQLSDCRIYATALSADDILKLYKNSKILNGTSKVPRDLD